MSNNRKKQIKYGASAIAVWFFSIILLIFAVSKFCLLVTFNRKSAAGAESTAMYTAEDFPSVTHRKIEFVSAGNTLKGYVWDEDKSDKLLVISHGWSEVSNYYYSIMAYFIGKGYAVLTYDNTGTGESEGFGTVGLSQSAVDLNSALNFIENDENLKDKSVFLFGHSWGGHAVTAVLNFEHKNIKAVASVAGYNSNSGAMLEWMQRRLNMGGFAYTLLPFASFWALVDAGENYYVTGVNGINASNLPVIVVQGGNDGTVLNDSIYSHRGEITNPNVEYYFIEDGTHENILFPDDEETLAYHSRIDAEYAELNEIYNGKIPEDILARFIIGIDKQLYNSLNTDTMDAVYSFFEKAA